MRNVSRQSEYLLSLRSTYFPYARSSSSSTQVVIRTPRIAKVLFVVHSKPLRLFYIPFLSALPVSFLPPFRRICYVFIHIILKSSSRSSCGRSRSFILFCLYPAFVLGVCSSCHFLSALREIVPGAEGWPVLSVNASGRLEAWVSVVEVTRPACQVSFYRSEKKHHQTVQASQPHFGAFRFSLLRRPKFRESCRNKSACSLTF